MYGDGASASHVSPFICASLVLFLTSTSDGPDCPTRNISVPWLSVYRHHSVGQGSPPAKLYQDGYVIGSNSGHSLPNSSTYSLMAIPNLQGGDSLVIGSPCECVDVSIVQC